MIHLPLTTLSDEEFAAFVLAADLAWRGIAQHPYAQTPRRECAVSPCDCGLCERAPQTELEAAIHHA